MNNIKDLTLDCFLERKLTNDERVLKPKKFKIELKRLEGLIEVEEIDYFYQARMIEDMERNKNNPNALYLDSLKIVTDKLSSPNLNDIEVQKRLNVFTSKELVQEFFTEKEVIDIADILIKRSLDDKSAVIRQGL